MDAQRVYEPGIYSLTWTHYEQALGLRKSHLDLLHRSPAHLQAELLEPSPPTDAMQWGARFHAYLLEPAVFDASYAVVEDKLDRRTKEGRAAWEDWQEAIPGKEAIDRPTMRELEAMRDSVMSHPHAAAALTGGQAERSIFWTHTLAVAEPIACKGRLDYITRHRFILDVKTAKDARADAFSRACWDYRYHVQAAYYLDGYGAASGQDAEGVLIVAVEKTPPYALEVYLVNDEMIEQGRREYLEDVRVYAECLAADKWPGYTQEIKSITLPGWAQERTY